MNTDFIIFACFCFLPNWPTMGILLYRKKYACNFFPDHSLSIASERIRSEFTKKLWEPTLSVCMSPIQLLDLGRYQRSDSEFSFKGMLYPLGKLQTHPRRIILFVFYLIVPENFFNVFLEEEFIIVKIWSISLILFLWPHNSSPYLFGCYCNGAPGHSWHRRVLLLH